MEDKVEKAKVRVVVHKIMNYKGCPVYLRQIGHEYFEYLLIIDGLIYSSYVIMKPAEGKKRLTKKQVEKTVAMVFAGAVTTIDTILDNKKLVEGENKNGEN